MATDNLRRRLAELDAPTQMTRDDLRRRLAELNTQILEHKRVLHDLEAARAAVEHDLFTTPYPVLTLAPEITAEIFVRCLPGLERTGRRYHGDLSPMLLMRVCRAWRDIALATPKLWSILELSLKPLNSLHTFFVVIRIESTISNYAPLREHLRHLGDPFELPLLRSVKLFCPDYDNSVSVTVFDRAPLLHKLHAAHVLPNCVSLPWLQLTIFEGSIDDLQLFDRAPNLVEVTCTLDLVRNPSSFARKAHIRLRSLTIKRGVGYILQNLTLSALQHLDVSSESCDMELEAFIKRSRSPLLSLSVKATGRDFDRTRYLFLVATTLENLHIHSPSENTISSIFSLHAPSTLSAESFPNIRKLTLDGVDPRYGPDLLGLLDFLDSRSDCLPSFRLVWDYSPFLDYECYFGGSEETISAHLSRLAQDGMDIYLGTDEKNYVL
ncbi:hypothetical protein MSAN_02343200 [Mycena sanguinolenta]|uniref:F-box domain-containing protein n=1 Tax=Mycena sanguinolenta TaxID=230812 RepID=A0A8H6X6W7_9AGAR|nr:hypothetical protein MSAN_02343200 [Mycena sanguinolenta]